MFYTRILLLLLMSSTLHATGLTVNKTEDGKKEYIITEGIFERPSGITIGTDTNVGSLVTDIELKYTTLIIAFDANTVSIAFQGSVSPLVNTLEKLFPTASDVTADIFSIEKPLTHKEFVHLTSLFAATERFTNIAKASFSNQWNFLKLITLINRKFPEIKIHYTLPWSTRALYKMAHLFK